MSEPIDPLTMVRDQLASALLILNCNADQVRNSLRRHQELVNAARKVVNTLDNPHKDWHQLKEAVGELSYCLPPEVSTQ